MKKILIAAGLLLTSVSPALAVGPVNQAANQQRVEERKEIRADIQEQKRETVENRCGLVTTKIETKVARYDNNRQMQVSGYKRVREWVSSLITKMVASGKDTANLKSILTTFDTKLKKFDTDYAAYIDALKATKGFACGKSEGQFKEKLTAARSNLKTLRDDVVDIRNYYQTQVRPAVQAAKVS